MPEQLPAQRESQFTRWRVAGKDRDATAIHYTNWVRNGGYARAAFANWTEDTPPRFDEAWIEAQTVTYSEPERIDTEDL